MIIAVVDDLLFGSKIRAAAEAAGHALTFVRRGADAATAVTQAAASLVLVDLGQPGSVEAISAIRAAAGPTLAIIAFASHVRADLIAEGRAAGATRVLARSAFVGELPALVGVPTPTP
jgi:CheY-like chemotaxis protein